MSPAKRIAALIFFAIASPIAGAQVKCTMPNGVTITQQLGNCPNGAVRAQTADGKPIALPASKPKAPPVAPATQTAPQPRPLAQAQSKPEEPTDFEYAKLICLAFEQVGATTCDVESNVFSDSTIQTTLAMSPSSAAYTCKDVAATMRAKTRAFEGKNWKIQIFSPFSGNRPIASCKL